MRHPFTPKDPLWMRVVIHEQFTLVVWLTLVVGVASLVGMKACQ